MDIEALTSLNRTFHIKIPGEGGGGTCLLSDTGRDAHMVELFHLKYSKYGFILTSI